LIAQLSKLTEGKTPEEIEAWKAEIDRARHPFDDIDFPSAVHQKSANADTSPPIKQKEAS
jgi:hypothetical protein